MQRGSQPLAAARRALGEIPWDRTPAQLFSASLTLQSPTRRAVCATGVALWLVLAAACRGASDRPAPGFSRAADRALADGLVDDFGDTLRTTGPRPERIVSLNPATTEMLFAMGDGARVVGRTRWDTYPAAAMSVADLGDGLRPNVEAVLSVHPDLVVLYAAADNRDAAARLRAAGIATLSVRDDRLADFRRIVSLLGTALHDSVPAQHVADSVTASLARVSAATANLPPVAVVWPIEVAPLRVIGGGSYLNDLLTDAGARNVYGAMSDPSPQVSLEDVLQRDPSVVLTTAATARAMRTDPRWQQWLADTGHRILVPDTALVGMPSVRMGAAAAHLVQLLHPEAARSSDSPK
jgi:iron complex transport system substrate-binding protein